MKFDQLVATVIHDLKNQLQSLIDCERDVIENIPKDYHSFFQPVLQRTNRLKNDTLKLLSLYKLNEINQFPLDDAWPYDTINDAIEATSLQFPGITFKNQVDEQCQGFYSDILIHLALITLITNSAQAGASEIIFRADDSEGLTLIVEDNGPGFPAEVLQGDWKSQKQDGTGLGLYFVDLIAKHHVQGDKVGQIGLDNSQQGGAIVSIQLP